MNDSFDKVECCFYDIVAVFWQQFCRFLQVNLPYRIVSCLIVSQSRNKLNMFNLYRLCRKDEISFNSAVKNNNNVEATFDFAERIVRLVAFDNVAST